MGKVILSPIRVTIQEVKDWCQCYACKTFTGFQLPGKSNCIVRIVGLLGPQVSTVITNKPIPRDKAEKLKQKIEANLDAYRKPAVKKKPSKPKRKTSWERIMSEDSV